MNKLLQKADAMAEWKVIAVMILATSLLYLAMIHVKPAPSIMEARNLVAARESVENGHWLVTTMNEEPRLRKPPLPTWIAALSMKAFGNTHNIYVGRAPNIIIASLMALFVYLLARQWLTKSMALTCALIAVSSAVMYLEGSQATWDIFTVCFAFGGVWLLYNAMRREKSAALRSALLWTAGAGLLWGMSFLSKGPITLYSILLPFLIALLLTKKRQGLRWWVVPAVIALGIVIGSSWWITMNILRPETMEILRQETQAWHTIHKEPFYYYLVFPALFFPWTLPLTGSFILPFIKKKDGSPLITAKEREDLVFFLVWLALSILLLSVVPEKKFRYSMTAVLPASLAAAFFLKSLGAHGKTELGRLLGLVRTLQSAQAPLFALSFAAVVLYYYITHAEASQYLLLLIPVPVVVYLILRKKENAVGIFVITSIATIMLYTSAGILVSKDLYNPKALYDSQGIEHAAMLTSGRKLYTYRHYIKAMWALGQTAAVINRDTVIDSFPALIVVKKSDLAEFRGWNKDKGFTGRELYNFNYSSTSQTYRLLELTPGDPD